MIRIFLLRARPIARSSNPSNRPPTGEGIGWTVSKKRILLLARSSTLYLTYYVVSIDHRYLSLSPDRNHLVKDIQHNNRLSSSDAEHAILYLGQPKSFASFLQKEHESVDIAAASYLLYPPPSRGAHFRQAGTKYHSHNILGAVKTATAAGRPSRKRGRKTGSRSSPRTAGQHYRDVVYEQYTGGPPVYILSRLVGHL